MKDLRLQALPQKTRPISLAGASNSFPHILQVSFTVLVRLAMYSRWCSWQQKWSLD
jgi:hypothetical protein